VVTDGKYDMPCHPVGADDVNHIGLFDGLQKPAIGSLCGLLNNFRIVPGMLAMRQIKSKTIWQSKERGQVEQMLAIAVIVVDGTALIAHARSHDVGPRAIGHMFTGPSQQPPPDQIRSTDSPAH